MAKRNLFLIMIGLSLAGCLDVSGMEEHSMLDEQVAQGDVTHEESMASFAASEPGFEIEAVRYCGTGFDCNTFCDCINGTCQPDGFGPPPEGDACAVPPQRACSSSAQCRGASGCACIGGFCQGAGAGPPPEGDLCAQAPPDVYEDNDDHVSLATPYLGSPQAHNFDDGEDVDWIRVSFGSAKTATFETYNLSNFANTYIRVYVYNPATGSTGALVKENDDLCGFWWEPSCWASRAVVSVPANSTYAVRIHNTHGASQSIYDPHAPGYTFRVY
jgi:hypothetical protein